MTTTRWLGAVVLMMVAATSASGITLCRSKRGAVNVRIACHTRETPLSVDALGVVGVPGASGSQGPAGPTPVHLVDANGVEVGPVLDASGTASNNQVTVPVLFTHASLPGPVLLAVTGDGRIGGVVYYASTDCTGSAFVDFVGWLPILQAVQNTVYVPGEPAGTLDAHSIEYSDPQNTTTGCPVRTSRGSCCLQGIFSRTVLTTTTTSVAALGLTPPFRTVTR